MARRTTRCWAHSSQVGHHDHGSSGPGSRGRVRGHDRGIHRCHGPGSHHDRDRDRPLENRRGHGSCRGRRGRLAFLHASRHVPHGTNLLRPFAWACASTHQGRHLSASVSSPAQYGPAQRRPTHAGHEWRVLRLVNMPLLLVTMYVLRISRSRSKRMNAYPRLLPCKSRTIEMFSIGPYRSNS